MVCFWLLLHNILFKQEEGTRNGEGLLEILTWGTIPKKQNGFERKNATECTTEPCHLLSLMVVSGDLVDPNPEVQLCLQDPVRWLVFITFTRHLPPLTNFPPIIACPTEQRTMGQSFYGPTQNVPHYLHLFTFHAYFGD